MGIFGKKNEATVPANFTRKTDGPGQKPSEARQAESRPAASQKQARHTGSGAPCSVINSHLAFDGNLQFQGVLTVDCEFRGSIKTNDTLVIGPSGKVHADIEAGVVEVAGKLKGDIHAKQRVKVMAGAEVFGNIEAPSLSMEDGVVFEGNCSRPQAKAQPAPEMRQPAPPRTEKLGATLPAGASPSTVVEVEATPVK